MVAGCRVADQRPRIEGRPARTRRYAGAVPTLVERLNRPIVALLAVAAIAGGVRFWALSRPPGMVFDEVYYPKAACILVGWSNKTCLVRSSDERYWRTNKWDVGSWVHPPLGKWEIALGIKAFGMRPFGWRVTTAIAGTLVVVLTAAIAQLLFGSPLWTFVTGLLLGVENLNVVMSRTALLDAHLELWVVVGFLALVLDRRWMERSAPAEGDLEPVEQPVAAGQPGERVVAGLAGQRVGRPRMGHGHRYQSGDARQGGHVGRARPGRRASPRAGSPVSRPAGRRPAAPGFRCPRPS